MQTQYFSFLYKIYRQQEILYIRNAQITKSYLVLIINNPQRQKKVYDLKKLNIGRKRNSDIKNSNDISVSRLSLLQFMLWHIFVRIFFIFVRKFYPKGVLVLLSIHSCSLIKNFLFEFYYKKINQRQCYCHLFIELSHPLYRRRHTKIIYIKFNNLLVGVSYGCKILLKQQMTPIQLYVHCNIIGQFGTYQQTNRDSFFEIIGINKKKKYNKDYFNSTFQDIHYSKRSGMIYSWKIQKYPFSFQYTEENFLAKKINNQKGGYYYYYSIGYNLNYLHNKNIIHNIANTIF